MNALTKAARLALSRLPPATLALLALSALAGCKREAPRQGQRVVCLCTYLTDYDDTARVEVEACIEGGKSVEQEAALCAGRSAHNHIDRCACQPPTGPCDPGAHDACVNR